jgi:hypothetical protein
MSLVVEWNASTNIFYLLKHLMLLILVIFKLKGNNLIFIEIMVLNASYVCLYAFLLHQESPDLILEDGPLISEVVLSQLSNWISALCYLPMSITIAPFIGSRHVNIHWKPEMNGYVFGIQSLWSFHFKSWSKFWNYQFPPIYPAQNSRIIRQLWQSMSPKPLIIRGCVNTCWRTVEVFYIFSIHFILRIQ